MTAFVVLNYNNFKDTDHALEHYLRLEGEFAVVVVDNASTDSSGERLRQKYSDNPKIHYVQSPENLGFSKGNNLGCEYAKRTFDGLEVLCVFNNDVFVEDKGFIAAVQERLNATGFDVLAPCIWNMRTQVNQNPILVAGNLHEAQRFFKTSRQQLRILKTFGSLAYRVAARLKSVRGESNYCAHGAALIFSKGYFGRFNKIFPELTFMYGEECFLYYRIQRFGLKQVFDYTIKVFHMDGATTSKMFAAKKAKLTFVAENTHNYAKALLSLYEGEDKFVSLAEL